MHELVAVNPAGIPSDANNQKVYKDLLGSVKALASPLPLCDKSSGEDGNVPEADGSSSVEENAPNACPLAKRPRRSSQLAPTAHRQQSWFDLFCGEQLSSLGGKAQQGQDVAGSVAGSSGLQLDPSPAQCSRSACTVVALALAVASASARAMVRAVGSQPMFATWRAVASKRAASTSRRASAQSDRCPFG